MPESPDTSQDGEPLRVRGERTGDVYTLALAGELDISTADAFEAELRRAQGTDADQLVIDLEGLTFMDSSGLSLLLHARQREEAEGQRIRVVGASGEVRRLLEVTRADQFFELIDP
jgi:anti-sigma B factor antagonist